MRTGSDAYVRFTDNDLGAGGKDGEAIETGESLSGGNGTTVGTSADGGEGLSCRPSPEVTADRNTATNCCGRVKSASSSLKTSTGDSSEKGSSRRFESL